MIKIEGKVLNCTHTTNTVRSSGEIRQNYTAEILHTVRGRSEIEYLKLDGKVFPQWQAAIGKEVTAEIRFYAMKSDDGNVMSGITLADKAALPTLAHVPQAIRQPA